MPLTDAEMDALSTELAFARPDTCVVKRLTQERGVGGGVKETRSTVATVSCRVDPVRRSPVEGMIGGRGAPAADYTIALPRGTVVREDDTIETGGRVFQVVGENSASSYHAEVEVQVTGIG